MSRTLRLCMYVVVILRRQHIQPYTGVEIRFCHLGVSRAPTIANSGP